MRHTHGNAWSTNWPAVYLDHGVVKFEARIKELVENFPDLAILVEPPLESGEFSASRSAFCVAGCWPSSATMGSVGG